MLRCTAERSNFRKDVCDKSGTSESGSKRKIRLLWSVYNSNPSGGAASQYNFSTIARTADASFSKTHKPSCVVLKGPKRNVTVGVSVLNVVWSGVGVELEQQLETKRSQIRVYKYKNAWSIRCGSKLFVQLVHICKFEKHAVPQRTIQRRSKKCKQQPFLSSNRPACRIVP